MKKKVISALLCATVAASMLAGCGSTATTDTSSADTSAAADTAEEAAPAEEVAEDTAEEAAAPAGDEGAVLNIYCWNEEFKSRLTDHYPGYEEVDGTHGKIGDVEVVWNITPSDDNAYQNNLDEHLLAQDSAAADDKIDLFLVEADYALKYVDTDYTMAVSDLGIAEADISDQYGYTQDIMTDSNGVLKGLSWQGCPAGLIYNREAAKEVLGTDDPDEVQEYVSSWDKFNETAATMKDAGYKVTATVNDTYRVYSNNVSSPWVVDEKINIDDNIMNWVNDSMALVEAGETGTGDLWGDEWSQGFYPDGKVFAYFGPAWFFDFCMSADDDTSIAANGGWGLCEGPQGFFWGGTWIAAATGTDNPTLVADIMKTMTTDQAVLTEIAEADSDFVNSKTVIGKLSTDESFGDSILGGQNALAVLASGADSIDLSNLSAYDQGCTEEFQNAMKDYFMGNTDLDGALEKFYTAISEKYPNLDTSH